MPLLPQISADDPLGRKYAVRMWALALGILVFASAQVIYAQLNGLPQLRRDGLDWGYDVVFYAMAALLYGRGDRAERTGALVLGVVMLVAGLDTLNDLAMKIREPRPIEPMVLGFSAVTAAASGFIFVGLLLPFRESDNPLIEATWVSARNSMISSAGYAGVTFCARLATSRAVEYGLDVFAAVLSFQAAYVIIRDALRHPASLRKT
jgi:Co/Zn/Cd efflux system component